MTAEQTDLRHELRELARIVRDNERKLDESNCSYSQSHTLDRLDSLIARLADPAAKSAPAEYAEVLGSELRVGDCVVATSLGSSRMVPVVESVVASRRSDNAWQMAPGGIGVVGDNQIARVRR